jgi:hypothetical protein
VNQELALTSVVVTMSHPWDPKACLATLEESAMTLGVGR